MESSFVIMQFSTIVTKAFIMTKTPTLIIALCGGLLLGLMIFLNGIVTKHTGAIPGSFIVHTIGLAASVFILFIKSKRVKIRAIKNYTFKYSHTVGIFGGIAVALIGYTVNTKIGIAGTIGGMILGQVFYGWANDIFGLFGSVKKKLNLLDFFQAFFIILGVGVIIYG
jgi:transporter family-2 protein